jgi:hypothetical protein
MPKQLVNAEPA